MIDYKLNTAKEHVHINMECWAMLLLLRINHPHMHDDKKPKEYEKSEP